ncbi:MAG: response regulator [Campylobacterota bacterium]|nr:response regulator [Campylobacterota bacterium]
MKSSLKMDNIKVIIVEDELIAAEYLKEILEHHGVSVIDIIDTGAEAIKVSIEKKPDLIFMDIMLRDNISGAEAALSISQSISTKIIFLTAYTDQEMVDYAVEANAVGYLTKPYNEGQIIATLRLAIAHHDDTPASEKKSEKIPEKIHLINGYVYLTKQNRVLKNSKEIELGPKALKLIALLSTQPNISISNEQISMHVWEELVNDRTLRSLMFRIRSATDEELIKNVSGTGYMIQTELS